MFDGRTNLANQVMQEVRSYFGDAVSKVVVPRNVRLSEAPSFGQPISQYDARSKGAQAYEQIAKELIAHAEQQFAGKAGARPGSGRSDSRGGWWRRAGTPPKTSSAASGSGGGGTPPVPTQEVALAEISPNPRQPRTHFDDAALAELADSIKTNGLLQPILVRPRAAGGYEIVAGERRYRAATRAGLVRVPVVIRDLTDDEALALALVENLVREDISPLETARALRRLMNDFGWTQDEAARRVGQKPARCRQRAAPAEPAPDHPGKC
jgi:ParB/RepB/Spo0J family partition protein